MLSEHKFLDESPCILYVRSAIFFLLNWDFFFAVSTKLWWVFLGEPKAQALSFYYYFGINNKKILKKVTSEHPLRLMHNFH